MKSFRSNLSTLKQKTLRLKNESHALYFAYKDHGTPWLAKALIVVTLCYLLSPIDLIPDFIPILGYADDLVIVPLLITLSIRLIPDEIMQSSRIKASETPFPLKKKWWMAILFILVWLCLIYLLIKVIPARF